MDDPYLFHINSDGWKEYRIVPGFRVSEFQSFRVSGIEQRGTLNYITNIFDAKFFA
jgi:hypothetical protein